MANGGRSQRELELEKKIHVLERCIGELTLEKELLKKSVQKTKSSRELIKKHKNKYPPKVLSRALGICLSRVFYILKNEVHMKEK